MAHLPGRLAGVRDAFVLDNGDRFRPFRFSSSEITRRYLAFPLSLSLSLSLVFSPGRALSRVAVFKIPHRAVVYSAIRGVLPRPSPSPEYLAQESSHAGRKYNPREFYFIVAGQPDGTVTPSCSPANGRHNRTAKQTWRTSASVPPRANGQLTEYPGLEFRTESRCDR